MKKKKKMTMAQAGRLGGKKGGPARALALSPQRRSEIARMGALAKKLKQNKKVDRPAGRVISFA